MTKALLALGAAALAAVVTRWIAGSMIPAARLRVRNHRGIHVPTGIGVAVLAGFAAGVGLPAFVYAIDPNTFDGVVELVRIAYRGSAGEAVAAARPLLLLGFGFGLLGLYDDLSEQSERGWRNHVPALLRGRLTPGGLKVVGGGTIAFIAGALGGGFSSASSFGWAVANAAIIALMANLFNALDVRPGRAGKFYLLGAVPMTIMGEALMVPLAATLGAVAAFLAFDLRERAMLGDTGSNALGAILGGAIVISHPPAWFLLSLLGVLVAFNAVAEGPTLSLWIDRIGPLRAFDRAGRVPDASEMFRPSEVVDRNAGGGGGELLH